MRTAAPLTLFSACVALLLTACDHKDLCFNHPEHATRCQTRIEVSYNLRWEIPAPDGRNWSDDWPADFGISYTSLIPATPEGVRVNAYDRNGMLTSRHLPAHGGIVDLAPGDNSLLLYNDDTEFIIFDNLTNTVSAKATTRARSRTGFRGNILDTKSDDDPEYTVSPPDPLFGHYVEQYTQERLLTPGTLEVKLQPLVYSYYVRYEFTRGIQYIGLARGAMSGMAASVYLIDGHTGNDRATVLYDCTVGDNAVEAVVRTFGIPNYPNNEYTRADAFYGLTLEVRLKNGKMLSFSHDVSEIVARQPHGGVIVIKGLEISDEAGNESGSGFDVDVEGWGEYEDVPIQL